MKKRILTLALSAFLALSSVQINAKAADTETEDTTDWSKYSYAYFYYQMKDANEKKLYSDFTEAAQNAMNSSDHLDEITADYTELTDDQVAEVEYIWIKTEAQYFFISPYAGTYDEGKTEGKAYIKLLDAYRDGTARLNAKKAMFSYVDDLVYKTRKIPDSVRKQKLIHDELTKKIKHLRNSDITLQQMSAASALIDEASSNDGYAAAFSVIMNAAGIPTITVASKNSTWNEVLIDLDPQNNIDKSKWYNCDISGDDALDVDYGYFYISFDVSDESLRQFDGEPLVIWENYGRPPCTEDLVQKNYDSDVLVPDMLKARNVPGETVTSVLYGTKAIITDVGHEHDTFQLIKIFADESGSLYITDLYTEGTDGKWYADIAAACFVKFSGNKITINPRQTFGDNPRKYVDPSDTVLKDFSIMVSDDSRLSDISDLLNAKYVNIFGDAKTILSSNKVTLYRSLGDLRYAMTGIDKVNLYNGKTSITTGSYYVAGEEEAAQMDKVVVKDTKPSGTSITLNKGKKKKIKINNVHSIKSVKWKSSDKSVAAVTGKKTGTVKGKKKGSASIKAYVTFKNGSKKTLKIKVKVK